jgi:hypothetical protein
MAIRWSAWSLLALLAAACAHGGAKNTTGKPEPESRQIDVAVENENWNTIVVYAVSGGLSIRMGDVPTGARAALKTPVGMDPTGTDFRLLVDPIGSTQRYLTPRLTVNLGDIIHLRVRNAIGTTSYWIGAQ